MNAFAFVLCAWVFIGMELGLRDALALGPSRIAPSFVFCFLTFIAMLAPQPRPNWYALALGALMDLTFRIPLSDGAGTIVIIGPHALAYLLAVQLIVALRGIMIRRNPLTMGFLAMLGSIVAGVTLVGIYAIRISIGDQLALTPSQDLLPRLGSALYTGLMGVLLALAFIPGAGLMGFQAQTAKRFARRM